MDKLIIEKNILRQVKDIRNQIDKILQNKEHFSGYNGNYIYSEELKKFMIEYYKDNKKVIKILTNIKNFEEYNNPFRKNSFIAILTTISNILKKSNQRRYEAIDYLEYLKIEYENLEFELYNIR